jgi:hypothetical protein
MGDYLNSCRSCWWEEGGRCYVGNPAREADGRSVVVAIRKCPSYANKRSVLSRVIPSDKLTIVSERLTTS